MRSIAHLAAVSALMFSAVAAGESQITPPGEPLAPVSYNAGHGRSISSKNRIVSLRDPTIVVDVDRSLTSLGVINFPLKKVAQVERYIFVSSEKGTGRAQRLFIAQFESVLPGVKGGYSFTAANPAHIGIHDYDAQVGFFNFAQTIAANAGAEAEQTKIFLEKNGVRVDDDFLVARYARVAAEDKRSELIFFYLENLRDLNATRLNLQQGGPRAAESAKIMADFAQRALASFKVVDGR